MSKRLGVGFIGSGFNTRFHILGWQGVRDADVLGVWSPNARNAESAARLARDTGGVGDAKAYRSITMMVADPAIDAIWLCGPNHARIENVMEIVNAVKSGKGTLKGIACEKPLGRTVAEAKQIIKLVRSIGVPTGYLREPAVRAACRSGEEPALGTRRGDHGAAVSCARRRGAQRPACALVLERKASGRRRSQ